MSREAVRFFLVSGAGLGLDMAVAAGLAYGAGQPMGIAVSAGIAVGAIFNFFAHRSWTFPGAGGGRIGSQLGAYLGAIVVAWIVRASSAIGLEMMLAATLLEMAVLPMAVGLSFAASYLAMRLIFGLNRPGR